MADSRTWWNSAAREDASWYIATASDPFFERGRRDTDELIAFCGLQPSTDKTLLEIGAGAGRMTHRFAELYGRVIALDVSDKMLMLGRGNLAGVDNVEWVLGSGADLAGIPDRSVDDVFSYITLQHVPTSAAGSWLHRGGRPRAATRWAWCTAGAPSGSAAVGGRPRRSPCARRPGSPGVVGRLARHPCPETPATPGRVQTGDPCRATTAWASAPVGGTTPLTAS